MAVVAADESPPAPILFLVSVSQLLSFSLKLGGVEKGGGPSEVFSFAVCLCVCVRVKGRVLGE